jgi:hypothetical protein
VSIDVVSTVQLEGAFERQNYPTTTTFQCSPRTWSRTCFKSSVIFLMLYAFGSFGLSCPRVSVSADGRNAIMMMYGIAITQAIGCNYTVPSGSPCLDLVGVGDCEVGKAVERVNRGFGCPMMWLLVDEAVGVPRAIVAGDCSGATVERIDGPGVGVVGHDEKTGRVSRLRFLLSRGRSNRRSNRRELIQRGRAVSSGRTKTS